MISTIASAYRSLPRLYWVLWLGSLVNRAGNFVLPFLAIYVGRVRKHDEITTGVVLGLFGCGMFLSGLVGGTLADRIGRRRTLMLSLFGGSVFMTALAFAHTVPQLCIGAFGVGLVNEMYRPVVSAVIADIVPAAQRPQAYSYLYWVVNLGFAIAAPLAGLALQTSYITLFVVDAVTTCLYGFVIFRFVPETRPARAAHTSSAPQGMRVVLADRTLLALLALTVPVALVAWQCNAALPLDMVRRGLPEAAFGSILGVNGLLILLVQPFAQSRLALHRRTYVLASAALLWAVGFTLHAFVSTKLGYAGAVAIWTLGEIALLPTTSAIVADLAPPHLRGRYQGMTSMAWGVASAIAPLAGNTLLVRAGSLALWGGCGALMVAVALGHLALGPTREAREAAIIP